MLDLVLVNNKARGIIVRNLKTGAIESYSADTVILATGGYSNVFYLSTNAKASNATAIWRAHKKERTLQILASHKFIQHAFLLAEIINPN